MKNITELKHNNIPLILQKSDKVIFLVHLAIGDFAYLQSEFRALKNHYPHLKIDLFVIESRCTDDQSRWDLLKNDVIYDWLENCGLFNKIYRKNYAPLLFEESIQEAYRENYPVIISLGDVHSEPTELYARKMANTNSIVVGLKLHINWYRLKYRRSKKKLWKNLDITFDSIPMIKGKHISDLFAHWFSQIGGFITTQEERLPYIDIPQKWLDYAEQKLNALKTMPEQKIVFINYLAKDPNRSWTTSQAIDLIQKMQVLKEWEDTIYILNTTPDFLTDIETLIDQYQLKNTIPFSAVDSFYELPALLKKTTLIISVETSIIHLANAVNTPLIALMRLKTPEWAPLKRNITDIIWCSGKKDNISDISPDQVIKVIISKK